MLSALPQTFVNKSGWIQNLVEGGESFQGVSLIHCLAGSRRSSHWHRTDSHYLYVVRGEMRYAERAYGSGTLVKFTVKPGQMVHTGPRVEHWTFFPVETLLISISKLGRSHEAHEADVVRVPWIDEDGPDSWFLVGSQ